MPIQKLGAQCLRCCRVNAEFGVSFWKILGLHFEGPEALRVCQVLCEGLPAHPMPPMVTL